MKTTQVDLMTQLIIRRATAILAMAFVLASPSISAAPSALPPLAAHRAVYELTLLKSTGAKSPTSAKGRIAFDFSGTSCEGYVTNFRQVTQLSPTEGDTRTSDMNTATFEDGNGKNFRFKVRTQLNEQPVEDIHGQAHKSSDGAVIVEIRQPRRAKVDLDSSVLFPTEHLRQIIEKAIAGEQLLEVKVYDGSDNGQKVYDTLSIIGRVIETPASEEAAQNPALAGLKRWPVTISYFEPGKKDGVPNYVLSFDVYENGISRALRLDYGDFVLAGSMTKLDILPQSPCAGTGVK